MYAFAEWGRLDCLILKPKQSSVQNGNMPTQLFYPGTQQSLNGKNYIQPATNQGADLLTTKLRFDVN